MKKGEYGKMLQKLDCRGSVTLFDENDNPVTRVDSDGFGRYSVYSLWRCHCSCIASEISLRELENIMVD